MNKFSAKAIILLTGAAVLMASVAGAAITYGVKYGPHNLGTTAGSEATFGAGNTGGTETEICIYCHTPHNAVAGQKWLWNRTGITTDFRFYTSSATINYTRGSLSIGETSKMCMTCHDGVTSINAMANPRPGAQDAALGDQWNPDDIINGNPDNPADMGKNIGGRCNSCGSGDTIAGAANLTNDHPISFDYVESYNAESAKGTLRDINSVKAAGLPFWGANGQMLECVTCHDPHVNYGCWDWRNCDGTDVAQAAHTQGTYNRSLAPFLRRNNHSSGLCFTCHNK